MKTFEDTDWSRTWVLYCGDACGPTFYDTADEAAQAFVHHCRVPHRCVLISPGCYDPAQFRGSVSYALSDFIEA